MQKTETPYYSDDEVKQMFNDTKGSAGNASTPDDKFTVQSVVGGPPGNCDAPWAVDIPDCKTHRRRQLLDAQVSKGVPQDV
jgi:hypothetical protein